MGELACIGLSDGFSMLDLALDLHHKPRREVIFLAGTTILSKDDMSYNDRQAGILLSPLIVSDGRYGVALGLALLTFYLQPGPSAGEWQRAVPSHSAAHMRL